MGRTSGYSTLFDRDHIFYLEDYTYKHYNEINEVYKRVRIHLFILSQETGSLPSGLMRLQAISVCDCTVTVTVRDTIVPSTIKVGVDEG